MRNKVKVSIIIPSYNRAGDLIDCLKAVFNQDFDYFEVIVIDDASTDDTKQILQEKDFLDKIVYLRNERRTGVSGSKNRGVKLAKGKYCWFLDSDTKILDKKCLQFLCETSERDSLIGSLGCEVIQRGENLLVREHTFFTNDLTYPFLEGNGLRMKSCDYLATCNCFVRKDLVQEVGGFNEFYFYGYEDAELGKKILDLGYKNFLDCRAAVFHLRSLSSRTSSYRLLFKNRIRFTIWNFSLKQLVKLPFIDFENIIAGIKKTKRLPADQFRGKSIAGTNQVLNKVRVLAEYLFGLAYGYCWNLVFLPQTLSCKSKRNFLQNV